MRKFILNLHLVVALVGGVLVIILGLTGSIIAFQDELDQMLNPRLFRISPEGPVLPLGAIQDSLSKNYPKTAFWRISFPQASDRTYVAQFHSTEVFVNSHTGDIIGSREKPTVLEKIRAMHTSVLLGKPGHVIVKIGTFMTLFLIISGIYLWWPIHHTGTARGLSFYLHYAFGIYFALFLLALSISGLVIGYDETLAPLVFSATHTTPPKYSAHSTVIPGATPITASEALRIATAQLPGTVPFSMMIPGDPKGSYNVVMNYPGEPIHDTFSWVLVDQYSGTVLFTENSHSLSSGVRIMSGNGQLHTGKLFGLPSQVVMSLSSLILVVQTITGYLIWWKKLRKAAPQR